MHHARIPVLMLAAALVAAAGCSRGPLRGSRVVKDANWKATVRLCELHENYPGPHDTLPKAMLLKVRIAYLGPEAEVELPTVTVEVGSGEPLKPDYADIKGGIDGIGFGPIMENKPETASLRTGDIVERGENCTWVFRLPLAAKEGRLRIGKLPPIQLRL